MEKEKCENCKYSYPAFTGSPLVDVEIVVCRRHPKMEYVSFCYKCGEYKRKEDEDQGL